MTPYKQFKDWYINHINCGGNLGTLDGSTVCPIEEKVTKLFTNHVTFVRKNWEYIESNYDHYINDIKFFIDSPIGEKCRLVIQHLWMADQEIHHKPIAYATSNRKGNINIHPGKSRLYARWAQNKSTDVVFIDYKLPNIHVKYKPFNNVEEAWNELTYTSHTPGIVNTCSFKNTHSVDDLIDITYQYDMDYYKNTDFEQILFIDDIKDYTFKQYQEHSKKYLNECLNNPIRYGNRVLNI